MECKVPQSSTAVVLVQRAIFDVKPEILTDDGVIACTYRHDYSVSGTT